MGIRSIFETVDSLKRDLDNLGIDQLKAEQEANPALLLVDIREIQEYVDLGTIPGAVHVPRGMLEFWADPKSPYYRDYFTDDRRIVLFCAGGGRSAFAARALLDMGYPDVAHLDPGFNGWAKAGEPVEPTTDRARWMRKPKADERPPVWLGHAVLTVPDPERSKTFFMALGMRDVEPDSGTPILELRGGTHLILLAGDAPPSDAAAPFDLMVDDVDAAYGLCVEAGMNPSSITAGRFHRAFSIVEPGGHTITVNSSHVVGPV